MGAVQGLPARSDDVLYTVHLWVASSNPVVSKNVAGYARNGAFSRDAESAILGGVAGAKEVRVVSLRLPKRITPEPRRAVLSVRVVASEEGALMSVVEACRGIGEALRSASAWPLAGYKSSGAGTGETDLIRLCRADKWRVVARLGDRTLFECSSTT